MLLKLKNDNKDYRIIQVENISYISEPIKLNDGLWNFYIEIESAKKKIFSSKYPSFLECNLAYEAALSFLHSYNMAYNKYIHSSEIFINGISVPTKIICKRDMKLVESNFILNTTDIPTLNI